MIFQKVITFRILAVAAMAILFNNCATPELMVQARSIQVLSEKPTVPYRVLGKVQTEPAGITTCVPFDKGPAQTLLRNEAFRRYGGNVNAVIDVKYEDVYSQAIGHY
ncbi:MAG: hypothetical protein NTY01_24105, partial [Verrucomicrobia bacterium]|nr:hypothetical protein [Verrucomicrobiota bacterium]